MAPRSPIQPMGLLNIDKPFGMTSRQVVDHVIRVSGTKRIGHAGTLDPQATGVLVLLFGAATRLTEYVQRGRKQYRARFRFQMRSSTDDIWGACTPISGRIPTEAEVQQAARRFVGRIQQTPPRVSAIKVEGKRAYQLARQGADFHLHPRQVTVHQLELSDFSFPECRAMITCDRGTYIRSIARDLGDAVGCPAVLSELVRTQVGQFLLSQAVELDELTPATVVEQLLPLSTGVTEVARIELSDLEINELEFGRMIAPVGIASSVSELAGFDRSGDFIGILTRHPSGRFKPEINFLPLLRGHS